MMNSTRDRWLSILDDFRSSHLTVREFCARRGVSPTSFYLRKRQLERTVPAFVEACVVDDAPRADIAVELPTRERVCVPRGACEESLVRVLRAVVRVRAEVRA